MEYIKCRNCGKLKKISPSNKNKNNFCSRECYYEAMKKNVVGNRKNLNKKHLEKLYINEKKSLYNISQLLGCAMVTVHRYMKRYGIKRRDSINWNGEWTQERRQRISNANRKKMLGNKNGIKPKDYEYKSKVALIRRKKEEVGDRCQICNWNEAACDGHHIKDRKNVLDNVVILCPNHHRLWHEGKCSQEDIK